MAVKNTESPRRRPKGDKRDRTRATLLEAARAIVREKGHARTTLAAVARRAGMTTGAIYGNFKNREELFIALGQTYWAPVKPRVKLGATFDDVIARARRVARTGDAVLLSPACSSFDMFKDYAERGRVFKQSVAKLQAEWSGTREQ